MTGSSGTGLGQYSSFIAHPMDDLAFKQTTVLTRAIKCEAPRKTSCLLRRGCDPNTPVGKNRVYPLMVACYIHSKQKRIAIFRHLLGYGADPTLTDVRGRNGAMYACALSVVDGVSMMIKDCDYDMNVTDMYGDTLLHFCAKAGSDEVLGVVLGEMLKYRMNISVQNSSYLTPLSVAILSRHYDCVHRLHQAGGYPRYSASEFDALLSSLKGSSSSSSSISSKYQIDASMRVPQRSKAIVDAHQIGLVAGGNRDKLLHFRQATTTPVPKKDSFPEEFTGGKADICRLCSEPEFVSEHGFTGFQTQDKKGPTYSRPMTSLDCINRFMDSAVYKTRISPSFCNPSKYAVELDSNWVASLSIYKPPISNMLTSLHNYKLKHKTSSLASSTSSSSSSPSHQKLPRPKRVLLRSMTSPRFLFNVPPSHGVCPV